MFTCLFSLFHFDVLLSLLSITQHLLQRFHIKSTDMQHKNKVRERHKERKKKVNKGTDHL